MNFKSETVVIKAENRTEFLLDRARMAVYLNLDLSTMSACMDGKMAAPPNANMIDPKAVKNPWVVGVL